MGGVTFKVWGGVKFEGGGGVIKFKENLGGSNLKEKRGWSGNQS